jgi:hypothetical protein
MYDIDGNGLINFLDLGTPADQCDWLTFIEAWLCCEGEPCYCSFFDWDCDGCVGPGDLGWWATGYNKCCDDPDIAVNPDWPDCTQGANHSVPAASADFIEALGLTQPPEGWPGDNP